MRVDAPNTQTEHQADDSDVFHMCSYPLKEILFRVRSPSLVQAEPGSKSGHVRISFLIAVRGTGIFDMHSAEITSLLKAWAGGDKAALDQVAERVYPEFRRMARRYLRNESLGNTLQPTAIIHEVYLRLAEVTNFDWQARAQFFAMAAQMMRRILVDAARAPRSQKRGGMAVKVNIEETAILSPAADRTIL